MALARGSTSDPMSEPPQRRSARGEGAPHAVGSGGTAHGGNEGPAAKRTTSLGAGHKLSIDLLEIILWQYYFVGFSPDEIALFNRTSTQTICLSTVYATIERFETTGIVDYPPRASREKMMSDDLRGVLFKLVERHPWLYLSEMADDLCAETGVRFSREHIHATLVDANYSLKTMQRVAASRDELHRLEYWTAIKGLITDPAQLIFGDETGIDGRTARRKMGWGGRGERVSVIEIWHRGKHYSILALYSLCGFTDFEFTEGGYNTDLFMTHIGQLIVRNVNGFPMAQSVLVLDNCRIHHSQEADLKFMLGDTSQGGFVSGGHGAGAILLYLAPYSPIDNPIEYGFSIFKSCWRKHCQALSRTDLRTATAWCFANCYTNQPAAAARRDDDARGTFRHCGYMFDKI